jgi:hypothetical protein
MSITFMGRTYKTQELHREITGMATDLAKNTRLLDPLPTGIDLSDTEQRDIQSQVCTLVVLF